MNQRYKYVPKCLLSPKSYLARAVHKAWRAWAKINPHTQSLSGQVLVLPMKAIVLSSLKFLDPEKEDLPTRPSQQRKMFINCPVFLERRVSPEVIWVVGVGILKQVPSCSDSSPSKYWCNRIVAEKLLNLEITALCWPTVCFTVTMLTGKHFNK